MVTHRLSTHTRYTHAHTYTHLFGILIWKYLQKLQLQQNRKTTIFGKTPTHELKQFHYR